jgi:hypothetical protein
MVTSGTVTFKEIRGMLDACAPGARIEEKTHHYWVYWSNVAPYRLPLGKHGRRDNPEIQRGHVKKMARYFEILDCAKEHLPQL